MREGIQECRDAGGDHTLNTEEIEELMEQLQLAEERGNGYKRRADDAERENIILLKRHLDFAREKKDTEKGFKAREEKG